MDNQTRIAENKQRLTRLGSQWGGLHLDLDLVPPKGLVISAGLADDISFDTELIDRKQCFIIGIDPTRRAAKTVSRYRWKNLGNRHHFKLIRKAVHGKSGLPVHLGGPAKTLLAAHGLQTTSLSLEDLVLTYSGASVLKLDIEGAEFPALECLTVNLRIPQVAIGFHTWLNTESDPHPNEGLNPLLYTPEDVQAAVDKLKAMGYKLVYEERVFPDRVGQETLFIRRQYAEKYHEITLAETKPATR